MGMGTQDVAADFVSPCEAGRFDGAGGRFRPQDVPGIEPMEGEMPALRGQPALKGKRDWWCANHGAGAHGPAVDGDQFAVRFALDVTPKAGGQRTRMDESGPCTVRDGRIAEERFSFGMG